MNVVSLSICQNSLGQLNQAKLLVMLLIAPFHTMMSQMSGFRVLLKLTSWLSFQTTNSQIVSKDYFVDSYFVVA